MLFHFSKPRANVCIRNLSEEQSDVVINEADFQRNAKQNIKGIFEDLRDGYYSDPDNTKGLLEKLKQKNRDITGYSLPHDILPSNFINYCDNMSNDLRAISLRTYKAIRWVDNISGNNTPFTNSKLQWSFDNYEWHDFVGKFTATISIRSGLYSSDEFIDEITNIIHSGNSEPLGHELLREAYSLKSSFPRSALLIAVSAAETAIKQCITSLQPETKWLVENAPSPNILKLFREYIPKLSLIIDVNYKYSMPTESILKPLEKTIQMRNIVAHGGQCKINGERLEQAFDVIKNLLWVIDSIMGNKWAIQHLNEYVTKEMNLENHLTK